MAEKPLREAGAAPPPEAGPDSPASLGRRSWWQVLRRTVNQFSTDDLGVWAAALTYYGMLSLFPGLLVLTALLGLFSDDLVGGLVNDVKPIMPGPVQDIVTTALADVQQSPRKAGVAAIVGLVLATWSASGYIDAFMKASNAIYDVPEGRPLWKRLPLRLGVTVLTGVLLVVCILIVVLGGRLADTLGDSLGMSSAAVTAWKIIKWPILVLLVALLLAILYWAAPNARQGGFRWSSPGGLLAVLLWILVSVAFGFYAANFASYTATYGALGGVIVFLIWLWLTNMAILLGAEFDAELERERAIAAGHPAEQEPYLQLRDDRKVDDTKDL
ncbi:YihY/virulence factor BrkB family protein [Catellatospora sp. KI3]|uniref:YihY/virulence factor BrkB family protein n=1 Tax=Catellatospora sp. KI3 TaxID=3041620 RepID=UPI002482B3FB|nr:YihY/virulence factor BrkB family protein [Catellatospora sp. KI3]MDI1460703.1 YihY/virulence factor BrkB family protein [Catellatospora sp. KI3]